MYFERRRNLEFVQAVVFTMASYYQQLAKFVNNEPFSEPDWPLNYAESARDHNPFMVFIYRQLEILDNLALSAVLTRLTHAAVEQPGFKRDRAGWTRDQGVSEIYSLVYKLRQTARDFLAVFRQAQSVDSAKSKLVFLANRMESQAFYLVNLLGDNWFSDYSDRV